jgi:hypothetical protein
MHLFVFFVFRARAEKVKKLEAGKRGRTSRLTLNYRREFIKWIEEDLKRYLYDTKYLKLKVAQILRAKGLDFATEYTKGSFQSLMDFLKIRHNFDDKSWTSFDEVCTCEIPAMALYFSVSNTSLKPSSNDSTFEKLNYFLCVKSLSCL